MKRLFIALLMLGLGVVTLPAQTTRVKGRVTDKETGEPIPFAAVYLEGTTIGVSTDLDGYYAFETRDKSSNTLTASILGYEPASFVIVPGSFSEVNFKLRELENRLNAAVIKPDNRYMKRILHQIAESRDRNNPEKLSSYACDTYTKMEIDMVNPHNFLTKVLIPKPFNFVYDYTDTSVVSGQTYLPSMISESTAKRFHTSDPDKTQEIIIASRISGLNPTNTLKQYTGSMPVRINFYDNFINIFDVEFPSPISPSGLLYYNYFLIDSLQVDAHKTYRIRFHPKKAISSPAFDGEMFIDASNWGLREIHSKMKKDGKVNWLRDIVIDIENRRIGDSTWFYGNEKVYGDFSVTMRDSSKMLSFIGRREIDYSNPKFGEAALEHIDTTGGIGKFKVRIDKNAGFHDNAYWDKVRPYELSDRERNIYHMIDTLQSVPLYKGMYKTITMLSTGYWETKYIGFGQYYKLFSFNDVEGFRLQLGGQTTKELSRKFRLTGYVAYGFRDWDLKGGGTAEIMFGNQPFRKLTIDVSKDLVQLGKGNGIFETSGSFYESIFSKPGARKFSPLFRASIGYSHEFTEGVTGNISLDHMTFYSNAHVPMVTPENEAITWVTSNRLHLQTRLSWGETFTRGIFQKNNFYSKYPVVTIDVIGGVKGITPRDVTFLQTEATLDWKLRLPPFGTSKIHFNGGHIQGKVPYMMLKLHEANSSFFYDKHSFACMQPYEFASDSWVTLFYEHNFNGFFLGRIPVIKKLQFQEVFTLKTTYGILSQRNREGIFLFPEGLKELKYPYVEIGAGITNIFRVMRVDFIWRMTHGMKFRVNVGLDFKF